MFGMTLRVHGGSPVQRVRVGQVASSVAEASEHMIFIKPSLSLKTLVIVVQSEHPASLRSIKNILSELCTTIVPGTILTLEAGPMDRVAEEDSLLLESANEA